MAEAEVPYVRITIDRADGDEFRERIKSLAHDLRRFGLDVDVVDETAE